MTQQRQSLGSILPRLERVPWRGIHSMALSDDQWVCLHRDCGFATRDTSAMAGHVVANQWTMRTQWEPREEQDAGEEGGGVGQQDHWPR